MSTRTEELTRAPQALESDPLWYKDAIIYELHVKAFLDSNADGIGDFAGLIQKLDYLQDLGVTCLWLLPFYPSPLRDDGYDTSDYFRVHPSYGTLRDFRRFIREAHRRGLRVITELVVNHTSDEHPWFQEARRAPPGSAKRNFYVWSDTDQKYKDARIIFTDFEKSNWTWDPVAKAYYWHRFFHHQPDLNYDNPLVRKAVLRMMRYWFDMGVDGLRLDAIPYLVEREGTNCENLPETHAILKEWRSVLDSHYDDRMFLAEANQWPADVRPYFGDGDECHMAFHFPLMPRMFMALRQEDRHPIVEIMRQTPEIPPECQWALFLRNHDELTLEMVTDEERDYMYGEYAADPQMRINVGIRRRLAPLLNNSRQRIELLTALLFSLPGTPLIYYGDEIGMGDNIYVGDRNGVRTPMQWNGDRNAGFSQADFAKLYLPPIMDTVYGYQAVNVEAQQRNPSSLLNWTKRLIALRKRYRAFGRGTLDFLTPKNRKILAYVRRYEGEIILAVANLSRFVQPAELDLSEFEGLTPIELFGHVQFPPIGELPYFITLGPHNFYWFRLEHAPEAISPRSAAPVVEQIKSLKPVKLPGGWGTLMDGRVRATLERNVLAQYLARQRWFGAKTLAIESVSIRDWAQLPTADSAMPSYLTVLKVYYSNGKSDYYFVPMALATGQQAEWLQQSSAYAVMAPVESTEGEGILFDALLDDDACRGMLTAIRSSWSASTQAGRIQAFPTTAFQSTNQDKDAEPIRRSSAEQSNTSVIYGERYIMKTFRRLEPGPNPDFEIVRYLTERTDFDRVPAVTGGIEYHASSREPTTLAMLQELVFNQGNGWERMLNELGQYFERAYGETYSPEHVSVEGRSLTELFESEIPPEVFETVGPALQEASTLGRRTAEMHLGLGRDTDDEAFAPEPVSAEDLQSAARRVHDDAHEALSLLQDNLEKLPHDLLPDAGRLLESGPQLLSYVKSLENLKVSTTKIRCHGDYHLGQVLWVENDFYILDFEGEPARPLAERRQKQSPLRDVAGMLRSFDYAAYAALLDFTQDRPEDFPRLQPWARNWTLWISATFLNEYRLTAAGASFLPADPAQLLELLRFYILEKVLYELQYELNNRPSWVVIPVLGLLELLGQRD